MRTRTIFQRSLSLLWAAALAVSLLVPVSAAEPERLLPQSNTFDMSSRHVGVVDSSGGLWMWGSNDCGQLGNDQAYNLFQPNSAAVLERPLQTYPVQVLEDVVSVSLGDNHTVAIKQDGSLWVWGSNQYGQLGNGGEKTGASVGSPSLCDVPVKVMEDVAQAAAGGSFTAAIKTDGSLWMWGSNSCGQLGNGGKGNGTALYDSQGTVIQDVPVKVMDDVAAVSLGDTFAAAIKTDGSLWMWGGNDFGQLGSGNTSQALRPVKVMENVAAVSLSGGSISAMSAVIKTDGSLWLWGDNQDGRLFPGQEERIAQPVKFLEDAAAVELDTITGNAVIKTDGSLWLWAQPLDGGTRQAQMTKVMDGAAAVKVGYCCVGAVKTDGTLWTWGKNSQGQLGLGDQNDDESIFQMVQQTPKQVKGITCQLPAPGAELIPAQEEQEQPQPEQRPETSASFSDVKEGDWFYPYVTELAGLGGVSGYPNGTFAPGSPISRLEVYTIALGMFPSHQEESALEEVRAQVEESNGNFWGNDSIAAAVCSGVTAFGEKAEEWNRPATREEIAYLLYNAYIDWRQEQGLGEMPYYTEAAALVGDYARAVALSDYEPYILWLYSYGIVTGVNEEGDFNPKSNVSRAECCTMVVSLYHPERWVQNDWDAVASSLHQQPTRLEDGTDFKGKQRIRYAQDVAYGFCRALEEEIGIQIFYLPEWTPKQAGLVQPSDLSAMDINGYYFIQVLEELRKMKEAYDLYPEGFLKEMVQRKGNRGTEIILTPYTFEGVTSFGTHVYDYSDDAQKVDQIYYTGVGDSQYYSHEMGHMVMSSAAILNGWNKSCETWESLSTSGQSYVSLYAMTNRAEDWAETWAYLWHQTDFVLAGCADSGLKAKVCYLSQLLDQYDTVDLTQLPWSSVLG